MRVLVALDKFKGSLSAREATEIVALEIRRARGAWSIDLCPITDGGDGFAEILTHSAGGALHRVRVAGPRGQPVTATYGLVSIGRIPNAARRMMELPKLSLDTPIAIVEMAQASGLALLAEDLRDPWEASTRGTGQVIRAAIKNGARGVLLGVGGSATHDLGLGALFELGVRFLGSNGNAIRTPEPAHWSEITSVKMPGRISTVPILIACDVRNPLLGPRGAARIYAPQKGLIPKDHDILELLTERISSLMCRSCRQPLLLRNTPGAGAAGGLSFGLMCAMRARLLGGSGLVSAWLNLRKRLANSDVIATGEGRFDESSFQGKGPGAMARRALRFNKPAHVFAGQAMAAPPTKGLLIHVITPPGQDLKDALRNARKNLRNAACKVFAPRPKR